MFKKNRNGWMDDFFNAIKASSILCRPLQNNLMVFKNEFYSFDIKGQEKLLHPPDVTFRLQGKIIAKLRQKLQRTRKCINGVLISPSLDSPIDTLLDLASQQGEDVGAIQEIQGSFCVGYSIVREEGMLQVQKRVRQELRRCSERSGAIYSQDNKIESKLTEVAKLMIRVLRIFLLFEESKQSYQIGKVMFYPKATFPLKKIKITPSTFIGNDVLNVITKTLNYSKDLIYGYISLTPANNGYKFLLFDKNDPELHQKSVPVIGVWIAGQMGSNFQKDASFWSIIMQYLTNPLITKRFSMVGEKTGILFSFDGPNKNTQYMFQFPKNPKWSINTQVQKVSKLPEQYNFSQQQVIQEEQKQYSEVQSISSKDRQKNAFDRESQQNSTRSLDQKDLQIKNLKIQLQMYKNQCKKLQELLANFKNMQNNQVYSQPIMYPNAYTLPQNNVFPIPPTIYPPQLYQQNSNVYGVQPQPIYSQPDINNTVGSDIPYFGKKNGIQPKDFDFPSKNKQFTVRDMKNISFAQQNSDQFDFTGSNFLQDQRFMSPQFREDFSNPRDNVKVNELKYDIEEDQKPALPPAPVAQPIKKTISNQQKEIEKDKQRQKQKIKQKERQRQKEQRQKEQKEKELQREKEKIAQQAQEVKYSKVSASYQSKYGSTNAVNANSTRQKSPITNTYVSSKLESVSRSQREKKDKYQYKSPSRNIQEKNSNNQFNQEYRQRARRVGPSAVLKQNQASNKIEKKQTYGASSMNFNKLAYEEISNQKGQRNKKQRVSDIKQDAKQRISLALDSDDDQQLNNIIISRVKKNKT